MIKFFFSAFDTPGQLADFERKNIRDRIADSWQESTVAAADVVLLLIAGGTDYCFDAAAFAEVTRRQLPVILLDYWEGPDWTADSGHGQRTAALHEARVVAHFKRELRADYVNANPYPVLPLDFALSRRCWSKTNQPDTQLQYTNRKIDVFYPWGYSNADRPLLHAELFRAYQRFGDIPATTVEDVRHCLDMDQRIPLALLFLPSHRRLPIETVLAMQHTAKLSLSLPGYGRKCWRSQEAGCNALAVHQSPEQTQWSFPWVPGHNCLSLPSIAGTDRLDAAAAVETLYHWIMIDHGPLYHMYTESVRNAANYFSDRYAASYLVPAMQRYL